jgi:hypothetical protein
VNPFNGVLLKKFQVRVEVETCEDLRTMTGNQKGMAASYASGGAYGFADKVLDGITLTVNSVILTLKSHAFIASFQVRKEEKIIIIIPTYSD